MALAPREAELLLDSCRVLDHEALLAVAVSAGIRRGDVVALEWTGVDLETGWITFWESKKAAPHRVPISGRAAKLLAQLKHLSDGDRYVWPSDQSRSGHISSRTAYNWLQKWLDAAGLQPRPFHALRATAIKTAQARGWTIEQVMALVNDTYQTIKRHYDTPSDQEMMQVANARPVF